jgi:general secretion pathway protein K
MAVPDARFVSRFPYRQRGVALVTALLVVALAVVAATAMATRLQVDVRRSANLLHGEQSYAYALAAESWAQVILRRDAAESRIDALNEDWATALPPISVEGGVVVGHVSDLQGHFNVNTLVTATGVPNEPAVEYFKRLLEVLGLDPALVPALVDWIDPNINTTFPGGAEDDAYLLLDPPYRAANRPLADISELRLVQGFTPEVVAALLPHVTALPDDTTAINVNTATPEVLQALASGMTAEDVQHLLADREQTPFADIPAFKSHGALAGRAINTSIDVSSHWFAVDVEVRVGSGRARIRSVVERDGPQTWVRSRTRRTDRLLPVG